MTKIFQTIVSFYKLAGVKKRLIFLEFIMLLIPSLLSIISPILAANVISDITIYDFSKAILDLSLDFAIIVVTSFLYFLYHLISKKTRKTIIKNLHEYVYSNAKENQNILKINSSVLTGIWDSADFNKNFLYKLCFFIKSIIILSIIIYFEFFIGIVIIVISIITFLLLRLTNSKIQNYNYELSLRNQKSLEIFNSIQKGAKLENNIILENSMKDKYFDFIDKNVNLSNKISFFYNLNNNFISLILKTTAFALTAYLITLVKSTTLTFSLYLVLTPYLTSSAENLIAFFELFPEIGTIGNTLKEFSSLKFQSAKNPPKPINLENFNLCFLKTSLDCPCCHKILDVDLYLPFKSSTIFIGEAKCGKRAIYMMLQKIKKPSYGNILVDNKNIFELNDYQYSKLFYFVTKNPFFYNLSIYENLYLVCPNRNKILKQIKILELKTEIDKLEHGINTSINEKLDKSLVFFLGIARAFLSDAKIICIYELPPNLTKEDKAYFSRLLKIINSHCTIILFSHENISNYKFDNVIYVDNSKIKTAK